ncbi:MAG: hypothetical protein U0414_15995 [Polyangiaceae bacterium]
MATPASVVFSWVIACAVACSSSEVAAPPPAAPKPKPVVQHRETPLVVTSVTTTRGRSESELKEDLLLALDGGTFTGLTRKFTITATLVTLEESPAGSSVVTRSVMEITVVDDTGKLLGTARGNARVEAEPGYADAATDSVRRACEEAVASAVDLARGAH